MPTEAGRLVAGMFQGFKSSYGNTLERIQSLHSDQHSRVLHLGMTPTSSLKLYDMLYKDFLREYPDVQIYATERPANEVLSLLFNKKADAVFTPSREELPTNFGAIPIFQSRIVLGLSRSSPLAEKSLLGITDILELPLGYLEAPMPFEDKLNNYYAAFGKSPNVTIRTSQLGFLRRLAENGHVATILPDDMIEDWDNVAAVPLDFFKTSTYRLVWDKTRAHNSAFEDFFCFVEKCMKERPIQFKD